MSDMICVTIVIVIKKPAGDPRKDLAKKFRGCKFSSIKQTKRGVKSLRLHCHARGETSQIAWDGLYDRARSVLDPRDDISGAYIINPTILRVSSPKTKPAMAPSRQVAIRKRPAKMG